MLAAAINVDALACVSSDDNIVSIYSEGYEPVNIDLSNLLPVVGEEGTSASLVRG